MRKVTLVSKTEDKSWQYDLFMVLSENETHMELFCLTDKSVGATLIIKNDYEITPADDFKGGRLGELSDGYHSFNELYDHRNALFCCLMNSNPFLSWKSRKHADGTMFEGDWFVAGMNLPTGPITYHLEGRFWNMAKVEELEFAPEWDGHSPTDVVKRLVKAMETRNF